MGEVQSLDKTKSYQGAYFPLAEDRNIGNYKAQFYVTSSLELQSAM